MTRVPCLLQFILFALYASNAMAWTSSSSQLSSRVSSMTSAFGGSLLIEREASYHSASSSLSMKKNRNIPPHMRSQYARMQEMEAQRKQMMSASKPGADGLPIFNLFVRVKGGASMWFPCGSFKGDERSAALCKSYADGGLLAGVSKRQLDAGISGSLYKDQTKLIDGLVRSFPQLRKSRDNLEFGYKLSFEGLDESKSKIEPVEIKEQKGLMDGIKNVFSFGGSN